MFLRPEIARENSAKNEHRSKMRAVYIDTELTQLNMTRQLISLALVSNTGLEFYVEITDSWSTDECSDYWYG